MTFPCCVLLKRFTFQFTAFYFYTTFVYTELSHMNVAELVQHFQYNPDFKGDKDITVKVDSYLYKIPWYCITYLLRHMPKEFFPCSWVEWFNHPIYFTSIEMVKGAIKLNEGKFKAFIYPEK